MADSDTDERADPGRVTLDSDEEGSVTVEPWPPQYVKPHHALVARVRALWERVRNGERGPWIVLVVGLLLFGLILLWILTSA